MEELKLEGLNYTGRFLGDSQRRPYMFRGDTHERHNYFWRGQCIIKEKASREEVRMLFQTPREGNYNFVDTLEKAIISFTSRGTSWPPRPKIEDHPGVADNILGEMYSDARKLLKTDEIIIPTIIPPQLDINEMVEAKLISVR